MQRRHQLGEAPDRFEYPDGNWGYVPYAQYVQVAYPQGGAPAAFGAPAPAPAPVADNRATIGPGPGEVPGGSPRGTVTPGDPAAGYFPGIPLPGMRIAPDGSALIPEWVDEAPPNFAPLPVTEEPGKGGGLLALLALLALAAN